MNWAPVRVIGIVVFGLIYWFLPLPFTKLAPYGSWLFWVSIAFWGGLCVLCVAVLAAKRRARKVASEKIPEPPESFTSSFWYGTREN
jgi:hypothetical protein